MKALIIGNAAYKEKPLNSPINDARNMANALKKLRFVVSKYENLDERKMKEAMIAFGQSIESSGVSLYYFSGHGLQYNGKNYLIPVDAQMKSEKYVESFAFDAQLVFNNLKDSDNHLNIIILDACRSNPPGAKLKGPTKGLAFMAAPRGTIIAFATAPGDVAADGQSDGMGLYSGALIKNILTPDIQIEEMFKRVREEVKNASNGSQIPWENTSLIGNFYFNKN